MMKVCLVAVVVLLSVACVCAEPRREFSHRSETGEFAGQQRKLMQGPEAMVERLEDFIRENLQDSADEIISWLETLKTYKPEEYRNKVREFAKKLKMLNRVKDKNPEKYAAYIKAIKLEIKCSKLGKKYGEAETEKDKEKIRNELKEVLGELFEIKQAENEDRIEQIEKKLSELKEKNSQRKEHREEIVNRKLEQMTASASGLAW